MEDGMDEGTLRDVSGFAVCRLYLWAAFKTQMPFSVREGQDEGDVGRAMFVIVAQER